MKVASYASDVIGVGGMGTALVTVATLDAIELFVKRGGTLIAGTLNLEDVVRRVRARFTSHPEGRDLAVFARTAKGDQ